MAAVESAAQASGDEGIPADRTAIQCPARLSMASGYRSAAIVEMTPAGAKLELGDPPRLGATVLLQWLGHEAFAKVAWIRPDSCGLTFERPLKQAQVFELYGGMAPPPPPPRIAERAANTGNIPLGQKRGGRPQLIAA